MPCSIIPGLDPTKCLQHSNGEVINLDKGKLFYGLASALGHSWKRRATYVLCRCEDHRWTEDTPILPCVFSYLSGIKFSASVPYSVSDRCIAYTLYKTGVPFGINIGDWPSGPPPYGIKVSRAASRALVGTTGWSRRAILILSSISVGIQGNDV